MSIKSWWAERKHIRAIAKLIESTRREITYEAEKRGSPDDWQQGWRTDMKKKGDCEDYVVLYRERLVVTGLIEPYQARMSYVATDGGYVRDHGMLKLTIFGETYYADNNQGLRSSIPYGWREVGVFNFTDWWDKVWPLGETMDECEARLGTKAFNAWMSKGAIK